MRNDPIAIGRIGSFHVEGREIIARGLPLQEGVFTRGSPPRKIDLNGEHEAEQMYVQYVRLAEPKTKYPLLMWHGGGMTGVTWEDTPDGRPGWQMAFLRNGHDVYVSDAVERGRVEAYGDANRAAGGAFDIIDLPAIGIRGNSHFPMMDDNSEQVAALVQDWITQRNLMK